MKSRDLITLRRYPNEIEARIAQVALEAHGIPSMLQRDDIGGLYPSLQFVQGVRLIVRVPDAEDAARILDGTAGDADEDELDAGSPDDGDDFGDDEPDIDDEPDDDEPWRAG